MDGQQSDLARGNYEEYYGGSCGSCWNKAYGHNKDLEKIKGTDQRY
jgi:hypothetical protein